jgi:VWFA-related protein
MPRYLIAAIAVLAIAWMLDAQDFQIKTRVDLVVVPTIVQDSAGKLVTGLAQKDFTIFEDGEPQTISNFSDDPQPLSAAIVVDTGMGGISMKRLVPLFISVTAGFSALDEMASFRYDHFVHQLSDFTANTAQIEKSFDIVKTIAEKQPPTVPQGSSFPTAPKIVQFLLGGLFSGTGGAAENATRSPGGAPRPPPPPMPAPQSRVLYDVLYDAAKVLETRPAGRRRIIFIISDGQVSGQNSHDFDEVTQLLLRDEIQLYAVTADSGAFEGRFGVLGSLALATGGETYRGLTTRSMEDAFGRITEQARNQYVLGYHSTNIPLEGMPVVRKIVVKGSDPKWRVIHRKGYTQNP